MAGWKLNDTKCDPQLVGVAFHAGLLLGKVPELIGKVFAIVEKEIASEKEKLAPRQASKRATDAKYDPGRNLYKEAAEIAKSKWEKGEVLKHHQMKRYLIREYRGGKSRFGRFDADSGYTEKGLLKRLKELAKEMNRPDLISGQKKSCQ